MISAITPISLTLSLHFSFYLSLFHTHRHTNIVVVYIWLYQQWVLVLVTSPFTLPFQFSPYINFTGLLLSFPHFIAPVFPTLSLEMPSMPSCLFSVFYGNVNTSTFIQDSNLASTNKRNMWHIYFWGGSEIPEPTKHLPANFVLPFFLYT